MEQGFRTERIPMKTKFGYSMGTMGDVIAFNFFYAYFIYYLTDFAGLPPVMAGIISMITVWFDAITDPIIGGLSDRSKIRRDVVDRSSFMARFWNTSH